MRINNNIVAKTTTRMLSEKQESMSKGMERVNSGYRVNRSADDTAGLAISEKMRGQIRGLGKAMTNTQDAMSMVNTAEGALHETHAMLQRIRELAVQSANDTNVSSERDNIQLEVKELIKNIDEIAKYTHFNTKQLIDGSQKNEFKFAIGANKDEIYGLQIKNMDAQSIGVDKVDLSTRDGAELAINIVDNAIETVGEERSRIGATTNRLEHTLQNVRLMHDNLANSESRIRDADMAEEMSKVIADKIVMQTGIAMQAHANTEAQGVLTLLGVR